MAYPDLTGRSFADLISLAGRTAVVTGGATGIGKAIATRLAEAGASVVIGDLDADMASATGSTLPGAAAHFGSSLDVNDHGSVTALADRAVSETGRIDIWVNNAGIYPSRPVLEITDAEWDKVMDLNLRGTFFGARGATLRMQANKGVIVNIVSTATFNSSNGANPAHYVASKHALAGLTKNLLGRPDDIARVVLFAASDFGGFVTGTVIPVDGGDLAR